MNKLIGGIEINPGRETLAEIPSGIESVSYDLNELQGLLSTLHQRLESIMPQAVPECVTLSEATKEPTTQLGQSLAEHARRVRQANSSVRNLLDRIKL